MNGVHMESVKSPARRLAVAGLSLVLALGLLGFLSCAGKAQTAKPNETFRPLYPVRVHDKWGYIDTAGALVVKPRFDSAETTHGAGMLR